MSVISTKVSHRWRKFWNFACPFGLDAPGVIFKLLKMSFYIGIIDVTAWTIIHLKFPVTSNIIGSIITLLFLSFFIPAVWMTITSCFLKQVLAFKVIRDLGLKGDEKILDVGCGHGLWMVAAAKNLKDGSVVGIDIWSQIDQMDNTEKNTLDIFDHFKVRDKCVIVSSDARNLSFENNYFDVVTTSMFLHNLERVEDRNKAMSEMIRVLKPGGKLVIVDFQFVKDYINFLQSQSCTIIRRKTYLWLFPPVVVLQVFV